MTGAKNGAERSAAELFAELAAERVAAMPPRVHPKSKATPKVAPDLARAVEVREKYTPEQRSLDVDAPAIAAREAAIERYAPAPKAAPPSVREATERARAAFERFSEAAATLRALAFDATTAEGDELAELGRNMREARATLDHLRLDVHSALDAMREAGVTPRVISAWRECVSAEVAAAAIVDRVARR